MPNDDPVEGAMPEADLLDQKRPPLETDIDEEAPADADARIRVTPDANEADVLEQSLEVDGEDDYRDDQSEGGE